MFFKGLKIERDRVKGSGVRIPKLESKIEDRISEM